MPYMVKKTSARKNLSNSATQPLSNSEKKLSQIKNLN